MNQKVRVRFAPSPTGALHIGGVRTALYNYLYAKQHGGDFVLRIEDTDSRRSVPGAEEYLFKAFDWLRLKFDESPRTGGKSGPYRQSERKEIYKQYVIQLLESDKAYVAFDTPAELDAKRKEIANFQYDARTRQQMRNSLTLAKENVKKMMDNGTQYVVRIKIEPGIDIDVHDMIRGKVVINSSVLDDKVIYKSADELPTYHLANVVDDHLMRISHVIRGEEWLPSAPLHVWLYKSLGWEKSMPAFAHLPLLLKPDGKGKLSKRDSDRLGFPVFPLQWNGKDEVSSGYRENGYLAEAVINFLAFLGWNPGTEQEIFSLDELVKLFSFDRCSKSGAKFDFEKAKWFNHQYIQQKPNEELARLFMPILKEKNLDFPPRYVAEVIGLIKNRIHLVNEIWEQAGFFFSAPTTYDTKTVKKRWKDDSSQQMQGLMDVLKNIDDFSSENQETIVKKWVEDKNYHLGNVMNAFRLAIVGESKGPHMFDITALLGKEETINRLHRAITTL